MFLQRKALYNLLQLNLSRIESGELKIADLQNWQTANFRLIPTEEIFKQLRELDIPLRFEDFEHYAQSFESPEEIVEALAKEREPLEKDHIFLLLFELWRRMFPERRTISIFCDELDYQMMAYDLQQPNHIQDALGYLQLVLDEHVDQGVDPKHAFTMIQTFCAGDIESFLFDFILMQIDGKNADYALELVEGFLRYIKTPIWFEYLQARAIILKGPEDEGYDLLEKVCKQVNANTSLDLVEEMLHFLAYGGNHSLFYFLAKKTMGFLKIEGDFKNFLEACYAHYDYLELKEPALAIARLFHGRCAIPLDEPLLPSDPGIMEVRAILDQKLHFAEE